ncbi:hypothetical protein Vretimale_3278 [Volvox reticuliferus]|uniref:Uncharacterized protein n=1 Tax=Volvox reticuliferus TaxID=1737510 RepID=A0A8J4FHV6_9CHLO|nr:hypothetical protein Vretifemale_6489 [Volvox reticuliferus]GIL97695.1 hypothetical protein Vretimale_3278 [Volvox reticuliferus]
MDYRYSILQSRNYEDLSGALAAFPNARCIVLDLSRQIRLVHTHALEDKSEVTDDDLVSGALDTVAALRHSLTSLAVLHLSYSLTLPSATALAFFVSCSLTELELQDISIQRAASDGTSNLQRSHPPTMPGQMQAETLADSIRARGTAMVQFACSLPSLRRLSLCNAAFSTSDIAALAALTQLEELSLIGAMECGGPGGSPYSGPPDSQCPKFVGAMAAVPTYKHLLAALPRLRRLRLPMAIPTPCGGTRHELFDSDDEDGIMDDQDDDEISLVHLNRSLWAGPAAAQREDRTQGRGDSSAPQVQGCSIRTQHLTLSGPSDQDGGREFLTMCPGVPVGCEWCFPPHLEELTIPLCFLNGPVFRAACEVYGSGGGSCHDGGVCVDGAAHRRLRSLHIICAPGYTMWEGSFLNGDSDFAVIARLAPSLESLHLSLEFGGSGRNALRKDRLRDCLHHLQALNKLQDLCITGTHQPVCFTIRKTRDDRSDILSYFYGLPRPCTGIRLDVMQPPAHPPFLVRPGSGDPIFAVPQPTPQPPRNSGSSRPAHCPDSLLIHWPQLRTLSVCGQCAIRSGCDGQIRLVWLSSVDHISVFQQRSQQL